MLREPQGSRLCDHAYKTYAVLPFLVDADDVEWYL